MDQLLEKTARKELDEELKRNKPKEVRRLYDRLTKTVGREDAYTFLLTLLSGSYELMPNGRYRLDHKKYNSLIAEQLKDQKKVRPVQPAVKEEPDDLNELLSAAADEEQYTRTMMSDFASQISLLMMAKNQRAAAELYKRNADLFFDEIDEMIAKYDVIPVSIKDLDNEPYRGYFLTNLIDDINEVLYNTCSEDPSYYPVYEEYLKTILKRPISWEASIENFHMLCECLYLILWQQSRFEEADQVIQEWKEMYPDSYAPQHALLFRCWLSGTDEDLKEGMELVDRILEEKKIYRAGDDSLLDVMAAIAEMAGDSEKHKRCTALMNALQ